MDTKHNILNEIRQRARTNSTEQAVEDREYLLGHLDEVTNTLQARVSGLFRLALDVTGVSCTAVWATARSKLSAHDSDLLKYWSA